MGAGQSADGAGRGRGNVQEIKTSYYELLSVERSATDEDIKKAYRRKALALHPDRNYGQEEAATTEFATISSAYEVLSDPQERAWYDSHEEAILRDIDPTAAQNGQDGGGSYETSVGLTSADDVTRLIRKFHGGVEYNDSPSGFYGFLREFFDQLAKEEDQAARRQDEDVPDYPSFGHKDDTHDEGVKQFYGAWAGFSTVKSFSWRDKYRMSDAEGRQMRRLIEKENLRFRKEGAQEFNDAVRSLVAFVRKRDQRYTPSTQTEAERQKILQDASRAQAARMRAKNAEKIGEEVIPEWARKREEPDANDKTPEEGTFDEESSEEEQFECVACRKVFKSEKQYEAHEKSNKHKKAVQALRKKLQKEGHRVGVDEVDDSEESANSEASNGAGADAEPEVASNADDDLLENMEEGADAAERHAADPGEDTDILNEKLEGTKIDNDSTLDDPEDSSGSSEFVRETKPVASESSSMSSSMQPKKGKAALKREKRAAKTAGIDAGELKHKCAVCAAAFPSKTQLFQHLKKQGHAAPVPQGRYKQPNNASKKKKG